MCNPEDAGQITERLGVSTAEPRGLTRSPSTGSQSSRAPQTEAVPPLSQP